MKRISLLLILVLSVFFIHAQTAIMPTEGDGTAGNPYHVDSPGHMLWIAEDPARWDLHYIQVQDMDFYLIRNKDNNQGWMPIGSSDTHFTGSFNGQNYIINGLYINRTNEDFLGLFGFAKSADFQNIRLTNVEIYGDNFVGGLVGVSGSMVGENSGSIVNCHVTGSISGNDMLGGLMGESFDPVDGSSSLITLTGSGMWMGGLIGYASDNVINCSAAGSITADSSSWLVGGLIGEIQDISIQDCSADVDIFGGAYLGGLIGTGGGTVVNANASGNVTGTVNYSWNVGGLVGQNFAHIINSSSTGNVSGDGYTGGLVGSNNGFIESSYATGTVDGVWQYSHGTGGLVGFNSAQGEIENAFARGDVAGSEDVGGFAGTNDGVIQYAYSTGVVAGTENYGGFCGTNSGTINSSYWNMETSGLQESGGGSGRSTEQMTFPYQSNTYTGWDFENIWSNDEDHTVNDGYPLLVFPIETEYFDLILEAFPLHTGTVSGAGSYEAGELVAIEASPAQNYVFVSWEGDVEHLDHVDQQHAVVTMPSDEVILTAVFDPVSSVADHEEVSFTVYPNPAYDYVSFSFFNPMSQKVRVALYNITGQLHAEQYYYAIGETKDRIDILGLHPGIYLLGIYSDRGTVVKKLTIKNN